MKKLITVAAIVSSSMIWMSCEKAESYSEIPEVEFTKVYLADTLDKLKNEVKHQLLYFNVIDGDGNLGLNKGDTTDKFSPESEYYHNLFLSVSAKNQDGEYAPLTEINENLKYRIPYNEPVGQNKYLKAEIKVAIDIPLASVNYDSIRYEFFVYDRELNKSNVTQSCAIPLNIHGTVFADGSIKKVKEKEQK